VRPMTCPRVDTLHPRSPDRKPDLRAHADERLRHARPMVPKPIRPTWKPSECGEVVPTMRRGTSRSCPPLIRRRPGKRRSSTDACHGIFATALLLRRHVGDRMEARVSAA